MSHPAIESHNAPIPDIRHYTDQQIDHLRKKATKQAKIIARYFWHNHAVKIGPGRLHVQEGYSWPVTSTRRAINYLTRDGILQKTTSQSKSPFGGTEFHWQWRNPNKDPQTNLFE